MKKMKLGLLPRIIIAIALGIVCGLFFPGWIVRIFLTVNSLFGNFLNFIIPLLILGLVAPGIADLGKGAGRLLLITALLASCSSGFHRSRNCRNHTRSHTHNLSLHNLFRSVLSRFGVRSLLS